MKKLFVVLMLIPSMGFCPNLGYRISFDYYLDILTAVVDVESGGDMKAFNRKEEAVGILQVRKCVLDDVNRVYGTDYTLNEMYNPFKAITVFNRYMEIYGSDVRIWNGGPNGAKKESTQKYLKKVLANKGKSCKIVKS